MSANGTALALYNEMPPALNSMNKALIKVTDSYRLMQSVADRGAGITALQNAKIMLTNINLNVNRIETEINGASEAQENYSEKVEKTQKAQGKLLELAGFAQRAAKEAMDLSDAWSQTNARINMAAREGENMDEIQQKLFESANQSRMAYMDTADIVAGMGTKAGSAFGSTDEIIAFTETMSKMYSIAGVSQEEQKTAMGQVAEALGSGAVKGEELNALFGETPNILQAVADYMNVPAGSLQEMADQGQITAEVLKNAMFHAAEEVDQDFEALPTTFSQVLSLFSNQALMALKPVWQKLGEISSSPSFVQLADFAGKALAGFTGLAVFVLDLLEKGISACGTLGEALGNNWELVEPVIWGAAAAMAWYLVITKGASAASDIQQGIMGAFTGVQTFLSTGWGVLTGKTGAASAAQTLYNSSLLACPLTWILIIITALIALLYLGVAAWNKLTGSSVSATGIIMGALNVLKQNVVNGIIFLWNRFAVFINFFANVWKDPVASVKILFLDLVQSVIGYVIKMAEAIENVINNIPGVEVDITSGLDNFQKQITDMSAKIKSESEWEEVVNTMDYGSFEDAYAEGYDFGKGLADKVSNFDIMDLLGIKGTDTSQLPGDAYEYGDTLEGINSGVSETASNTGKSLDISDENLKYMRELAEQQTINRFTTAEIKVDMVNNNNVSSNLDLDGIVDHLVTGVQISMEQAAEGVHT